MATFGKPAEMTDDDDVMEGLRFWQRRVRSFQREGEAEAAQQAHAAAEEFRTEAEKRGLL